MFASFFNANGSKIIPRKLHGLAQNSFAIQQNIFLKVIYEDSLWHQNMFANTGKGNWSFIFVIMLAKLVHMGWTFQGTLK